MVGPSSSSTFQKEPWLGLFPNSKPPASSTANGMVMISSVCIQRAITLFEEPSK